MRRSKEDLRKEINRLKKELERLDEQEAGVAYPDDPPASILTNTQRDILVGGESVSGNSAHERTLKSRIRERVVSGVVDLSAMKLHLPREEREKIASNLTDRQVDDAIDFLDSLK